MPDLGTSLEKTLLREMLHYRDNYISTLVFNSNIVYEADVCQVS
jgi:hypothetical protein